MRCRSAQSEVRALSVPTTVDAPPQQLVVVTVGSDRCALAVGDVVEVLPMALVSPLPGVPEVVEGVLEVRGDVLVVFDLGRRLGHPPAPPSLHHRLVVVQARRRRLALRVDTAELVAVPATALRENRAPELDGARSFVVLGDGVVVISDVDRFLSPAEDAAIEAALVSMRSSS